MKQKVRQRLEALWGAVPDEEYFPEDLAGIRTYYEYRRENGLDAFYIDDTTWRDLSMDEVYKRINGTLSTSGEQVLYSHLRTPALNADEQAARGEIIAKVGEDAGLRLALCDILSRVDKSRAANTTQAFHPTSNSPLWLVLTAVLVVLLMLCIIGLAVSGAFVWPLLAMLFINAIYHTYMMHRMEKDLSTVTYSVAMVAACRRIRRLNHPFLQERFGPALEAGERAKSIARLRGITTTFTSDLATFVNIFFLTNILTYERLKNKLWRYHADIFAIHEMLGRIDAAIAVASYRQSVKAWATPVIDYRPLAAPSLHVTDIVHPLVSDAVPNTLQTGTPLLVTGSNASGKSTFLKAVAINALLAQAIDTALCSAYEATSFRLYTSMAITDNVMAGESYFIAEIKSIKRIVDAARRRDRILCVIDEVLRGTNTVERIAASSELLWALEKESVLCLAATHDGELCTLLPGYRQVHFRERIQGDSVLFDYLLHEGPATTRNAIRLLAVLGFGDDLVRRAGQKAERYLSTGRWTNAQ